MKLDLCTFRDTIFQTAEEEPVSTQGVNTYLLEAVIRPTLRGNVPRYGELDYDSFDDIDLRVACDYCERRDKVSYRLETLTKTVSKAAPTACCTRSYC